MVYLSNNRALFLSLSDLLIIPEDWPYRFFPHWRLNELRGLLFRIQPWDRIRNFQNKFPMRAELDQLSHCLPLCQFPPHLWENWQTLQLLPELFWSNSREAKPNIGRIVPYPAHRLLSLRLPKYYRFLFLRGI